MHTGLRLSAILIILSLGTILKSQDESTDHPFFGIEARIGETFPSSSLAPDTKSQLGFKLGLGKQIRDIHNPQASYLNFPEVSLGFGFTDFGHREILGYAYSLVPAIDFSFSRKQRKGFGWQLGLGGSYMDRQFDEIENPTNLATGSSFVWSFESFIYYKLSGMGRSTWSLGLGIIHHSNGHTTLPNHGMNSVVARLSYKLYSESRGDEIQPSQDLHSSKMRIWSIRYGYGWHELGGPSGPVGTPKKDIHSLSAYYGWVIKQTLQLRVGVGYRFYQSYYDYIKENQTPEYADNPVWNASNLYISFGGELTLGHVGMDLEMGFNLFKPFYDKHFELFEFELNSNVEKFLKETVLFRIGLKYYLKNTLTTKSTNYFVGAYINTNFGQADFSEFSFGIVRMF